MFLLSSFYSFTSFFALLHAMFTSYSMVTIFIYIYMTAGKVQDAIKILSGLGLLPHLIFGSSGRKPTT